MGMGVFLPGSVGKLDGDAVMWKGVGRSGTRDTSACQDTVAYVRAAERGDTGSEEVWSGSSFSLKWAATASSRAPMVVSCTQQWLNGAVLHQQWRPTHQGGGVLFQHMPAQAYRRRGVAWCGMAWRGMARSRYTLGTPAPQPQ